MKHYVYEWFIVGTGEVIYVGKGTGNRYKVRKHNVFFNDMIKRFICDSRIVKEFNNEQDAFSYEFERVKELKNEGQCVCNIKAGGCGGTVESWTEEKRKKYSERNVMKAEHQRKRMSEHNPMKDKTVAARTNAKKRRPVIIGETEYDSVKSVMLAYGVCYDVVSTWCRKGITSSGEKCRYKDSEQIEFTDSRYNMGSSKPLSYDGNRYESMISFASAIGISISTAYTWLKRGFDTKGIPCRYDDDVRELEYVDRIASRRPQRSIPVIVNGARYESCKEASKALNINYTTLHAYLRGIRKSDKYKCAYDNQQPSRAKSGNSSTEGSTTNR